MSGVGEGALKRGFILFEYWRAKKRGLQDWVGHSNASAVTYFAHTIPLAMCIYHHRILCSMLTIGQTYGIGCIGLVSSVKHVFLNTNT